MRRKIQIITRVAKILRISWYHLFGTLFLTVNCYGIAEVVFRRGRRYAERAHPESVDALDVWIAFTYEQRGDTAGALRLLRNRVETNPERTSYLIALADLYLATGDKDHAIDAYQRVIILETDENVKSSIRSQIEKLEQGK